MGLLCKLEVTRKKMDTNLGPRLCWMLQSSHLVGMWATPRLSSSS